MELQSLPTVPAGSVAGMIFSLAAAFGLPIGLYLYLKHKKYARTSSFVAGMLVFILFAMVLESLVHSLVFSLTGTAITGSLFFYAVYAALMAAAFEETGRWLAMRFVLRRLDGKNALMYGAGHGGAEAMILLGLTSINNLVNATLINSGELPGVLSGLDEATAESVLAGVSQLWTAPAYLVGAGLARGAGQKGRLVLGGLRRALRGRLCRRPSRQLFHPRHRDRLYPDDRGRRLVRRPGLPGSRNGIKHSREVF